MGTEEEEEEVVAPVSFAPVGVLVLPPPPPAAALAASLPLALAGVLLAQDALDSCGWLSSFGCLALLGTPDSVSAFSALSALSALSLQPLSPNPPLSPLRSLLVSRAWEASSLRLRSFPAGLSLASDAGRMEDVDLPWLLRPPLPPSLLPPPFLSLSRSRSLRRAVSRSRSRSLSLSLSLRVFRDGGQKNMEKHLATAR